MSITSRDIASLSDQLTDLNLHTERDLSRGGSVVQTMHHLEGADTTHWLVVVPDYWPEAANQMGEGDRWRVAAQKDKAFKLLAAYGHPAPRFESLVTARFVRLYGKTLKGAWEREKDESNLHASTKYLEDALKRPCGREVKRRMSVIVNDSPKWFKPTWEQHRSVTGRAYCVVSIEGILAPARGQTR